MESTEKLKDNPGEGRSESANEQKESRTLGGRSASVEALDGKGNDFKHFSKYTFCFVNLC